MVPISIVAQRIIWIGPPWSGFALRMLLRKFLLINRYIDLDLSINFSIELISRNQEIISQSFSKFPKLEKDIIEIEIQILYLLRK